MRKKCCLFFGLLAGCVLILAGCGRQCAVDGCENKPAEGSEYCEEHTCNIDGCFKVKKGGSEFCENHTCSLNACCNLKKEGSEYCAEHCCIICNNKIDSKTCKKNYKNEYFCDDCFNDSKCCVFCHHPLDPMHIYINNESGEKWCKECNNFFPHCNYCGNILTEENPIKVNGYYTEFKYYCSSEHLTSGEAFDATLKCKICGTRDGVLHFCDDGNSMICDNCLNADSSSEHNDNTTDITSGYEPNRESDAWVCALDIAKSGLKVPSTADFCSYPEATVTYNGGADYTVSGYVDAENGFGATIRSYFTVTLTLTEKGYKNGYVSFS